MGRCYWTAPPGSALRAVWSIFLASITWHDACGRWSKSDMKNANNEPVLTWSEWAILRTARRAELRLKDPAIDSEEMARCHILMEIAQDVRLSLKRRGIDLLQVNSANAPSSSPPHSNVNCR